MFGKEISCGVDKKNNQIKLIGPDKKNLSTLVGWLNDHEVMRLLDPHANTTNVPKEKKRLEEFEKSEDTCVWQITSNDKFIGTAWLHDIQFPEATAFSGILIGDKNCWGCGIASVAQKAVINYAFNELKLNYLFVIIFSPNIASRRVFENLGFKQYGIKPAAAFIDGKLYDGWEAFLSKDSWEKD